MLKTNTVINYIPLTINYFPKNRSKMETNNLIAVGRLEKEKCFTDLIDVIAKAVKKNKNLKLTIIGDGSQRAIIENKIKELKLDKNIKITGFISQEEIKKYYEKASLLINTSYEESFGLVLLEAASYGIPSLAFSSALGAKEIIGENFGKIIDNRDLNKMSKAIVDYTKGSLIFNYDEIRKHAKNYYTETVKNNWFEFIEKAKSKEKTKKVLFISSDRENTLSGIFFENFVANELIAKGLKLFYWRGKASAELEFIIESNNKLYPIDVKKGRGTLNSLEKFSNHNKFEYAIKISQNNYGYHAEQKLLTIPFYFIPFAAKSLADGTMTI